MCVCVVKPFWGRFVWRSKRDAGPARLSANDRLLAASEDDMMVWTKRFLKAVQRWAVRNEEREAPLYYGGLRVVEAVRQRRRRRVA